MGARGLPFFIKKTPYFSGLDKLKMYNLIHLKLYIYSFLTDAKLRGIQIVTARNGFILGDLKVIPLPGPRILTYTTKIYKNTCNVTIVCLDKYWVKLRKILTFVVRCPYPWIVSCREERQRNGG